MLLYELIGLRSQLDSKVSSHRRGSGAISGKAGLRAQPRRKTEVSTDSAVQGQLQLLIHP